MQTAHALWWPLRGLAVWGEDADRPLTSGIQARRTARPHTFAASAEQLRELSPDVQTVTLALPSALSSPLDSPQLLRIVPRSEPKAVSLLAWTVPVALLSGPDALSWLSRLADPDADDGDTEPPFAELRLGASVRFFGELAAFAVDLVERGQFLPALTDAVRARWRAVLHGLDASFAAGLAAALPPVARALVDGPQDLSGLPASVVVDDALDALVDAAVRRRLGARGVRLLEALPPRRGRRPATQPASELFVEALSGAQSAVVPAEAAGLLRVALAPLAEVGTVRTVGARLLLRLAEPAEADASWELSFSLQSATDESLIVPAEQVWEAGASLDRWIDKADETLLAELGRASKVWPELDVALRQARPDRIELDLAAVHAFLTDAADRLRQNDIAVRVPNWWRRPRVGLSGWATSEPGGPAEGMLTKDTLCQFSWRLAVGDTVLDDDEIEALAASKMPLVQLRGEWVAFDPEAVRRGLEFLRAQADAGPKTVGEVIGLATGMTPTDGVPVVKCGADGLLGDLLRGDAAAALKPIKTPGSFAATLRPYQRRGLSWLAFLSSLGLGACLADDMGLGKTVQLLALEAHERRGRTRLPATLLVCPVSLVGNWQAEAARFAPRLRVYAHHGAGRLHGEALAEAVADADLVVTTYQLANRDLEELSGPRWRRVVLDEAQFVKNAATAGAKAVRALPSDHRIALTGTPVENKLAELRSIMDFLNPGILGSPEQFRSRFARPIESGHETEPAQRLRAITRPFILRRTKSDKTIISDLPEKIETKQTCLLTAEQASLYAAVVTQMMAKIEASTGIERRGNVLAAMTKLKQICNHPAQFLHDGSSLRNRSGKIERLDQIVEEILAEGEKALIFTQFTEFGDMLMRHLGARFNQDVLYLHGQVPAARRAALVESFQADGGPSLFLLSLRAGGTGLNLTAASHVIHVDRWWNPAVENQATDRAYRIGQNRRVQVHTFVCRGTLEEHIDAMIEQKKALSDLVIGEGEGWLTELSTDQLRSVFALSREAIDE